MYRKSYAITNSFRYVKKTEFQQRVELQIRKLQLGTSCHSSAFNLLQQLRKTDSVIRLKQKTSAVLHLARYSL